MAAASAQAGPIPESPATAAPASMTETPEQEASQGRPQEASRESSQEPSIDLSRKTPDELSKKARWLREKRVREDVHFSDDALARAQQAHTRWLRANRTENQRRAGQPPAQSEEASSLASGGDDPTLPALELPETMPPPGTRFEPIVTLFNLHTRDALPVLPGRLPRKAFHGLLRDHFTNQATSMDPRLFDVLTLAALHFTSNRIDIISGYRSPKYNLTLRKKGREVAEKSKHTLGQAVDFRVRGADTRTLWRFVRSLRLGGVGFYPRSRFIHCDTGPVRFWRGS